MFDNFSNDELSRVAASPVKSEYELSVHEDIKNWVYEQNLLSLANGDDPVEFSSFQKLVDAYWRDRFK